MSRAIGTLFILLLAVPAIAQTDYHISQDPNHNLYSICAFAHGHRHGYEDGFHAGNEDYQMRRVAVLQKLPRDKGYRKPFGDKVSYLSGYETGFKAGYADSYAGRSFRLWSPQEPVTTNASRDFDQGLTAGYQAGFTNSASIAEAPGVSESAAWRCRQEPHAEAYCNGFGAGYLMGRADQASIARLSKDATTTLAKNSR